MKKDNEENDFREDEIVRFSRWDSTENQWVNTIFPKISGRLRLAHKNNDQLSITTEVLRNDEIVAIVRAKIVTIKGSFTGIGMASSERDKEIAPAILELAETRAISRGLRFAGYGIEYCSAEEISHIRTNLLPERKNNILFDSNGKPGNLCEVPAENGKSRPIANSNRVSDDRLSDKQLQYIIRLGREKGLDIRQLEKQSIETIGVRLGNLNKIEASKVIDLMRESIK